MPISRAQRAGLIAGGVVVAWLLLLVIVGAAFGGARADRVAERIGESLQAQATIEDRDLALVRGRFSIDHLRVTRDDSVGKLSLDVGNIRCELAPLGLALIDSSCRELAIGGVRLSLSTFALLKLRKPKRPPIRAGAVVIDDAELTFSAGPAGKMRLAIARAEAGATTFKTPLSWIFEMTALRATLDLPIGTIQLAFAGGMLTASGSILGTTPVTVPVTLPRPDPDEDPQREVERLVKLGRELAERLVAQKARDWLRDKLR